MANIHSVELSVFKFDYGARTDKQPIYIGRAPAATVDSTVRWEVTKIQYESSTDNARILTIDKRYPMTWTNRTSPTTDGKEGWGF